MEEQGGAALTYQPAINRRSSIHILQLIHRLQEQTLPTWIYTCLLVFHITAHYYPVAECMNLKAHFLILISLHYYYCIYPHQTIQSKLCESNSNITNLEKLFQKAVV